MDPQVLQDSEYGDVLAHFDQVAQQTSTNEHHRLFWGFNSSEDQISPILELAVQYYQQHGRAPTREEGIQTYYLVVHMIKIRSVVSQVCMLFIPLSLCSPLLVVVTNLLNR